MTRNSDPHQADIDGRGKEIQGRCFTPNGKFEQFADAGALVSGVPANSSRQVVDDSWQSPSSALCGGSRGEAGVRLRPEDWANAPAFVPGQKWQFRSKLRSFNR